MHGFLRNLISSFPHPTHPRFKELLRALHGAGDAFGQPGALDGAWAVSTAYQAIETFRQEPERGFSAGDAGGSVRAFRSSGTTQGACAASHFSGVGLDFYELGSLIAFFSMIQRVFPGQEPFAVPGVSLVPSVADWGDSSLAQMVAWIAKWAPVEYATENAGLGRAPRWVFGTAFHFVNLIDAGRAAPLPEGSLIIETGGTKGRAREIGRAEFYAELTRAFGVPRARIVSEYGMCELAAQAYDFEGDGFRFPFWVTPAVVTGPGVVAKRGEGLLLVNDPLRVDHALAIRAEDLARVEGAGRFQLLGRAPKAPLKGCSLLAEEVAAAGPAAPACPRIRTFRPDPLTVDRARRKLFQFLTEGEAHAALTADLGGEALAKAALEDLAQSVPTSEAHWREAAAVAADRGEIPARWLLILPENHPVVGVYPVALGAALGLDLTVRIPGALAGDGRFLALLLAAFGAKGVAATFRINSALDVAAFDAILMYGDDDTVARVRAASGGKPVVGFGGRAGASLIDGADPEPRTVKALARDAFGLGQAGCMSVRLAVVIGAAARAREFSEAVRKAGEDFLHAMTIPAAARIGHELEATRLAALGFTVLAAKGPRTPLIAYKQGLSHASEALALRPYTLPLLFAGERAPTLFAESTFGTVTASPRYLDEAMSGERLKNPCRGKSFRPLGRANAPAWDGLHEGRPLFRAN